MIVECAWCGKYMGEKPPYEDKRVSHSICDECKAKYFPELEKPTKKELTDFALKIVAAMRGQSAGVIAVPQFRGWTSEELDGTANLLLQDLREDRTEELGKLYLLTGGEPFKREITKLEIGEELG